MITYSSIFRLQIFETTETQVVLPVKKKLSRYIVIFGYTLMRDSALHPGTGIQNLFSFSEFRVK